MSIQDEARADTDAGNLFCDECSGPYNGWLMERYGGHWDTCPNRTPQPEAAPSTIMRYEPCVVGADGECTRWSHNHTAASQPEATSDTGMHDRDHMGICRSCGSGITAVEVLDGEKRCVSSQPVQVEVTDDMIARAEREYQWSGNIRKVLVAALGGGE